MEYKKHILFISSWYPNRNNPTHGIFNRYFAEAAALDHKVSVLHVCSDENIADTELEWQEKDNITTLVVYYKKIKTRLPLLAQLQKRKALLHAFDLGFEKLVEKTGMPDLVQLNVIMPAGIGAYHLSKKHHIPFIINEGWSGYCPEDGNYKGAAQKFFTKKITAAAKAIMPVSGYLKNAMLAHGLSGNYTIVPNVVDIHLFTPQPTGIKDNITRFIHISTLDDVQKNVSGIIRAFALACKTNPSLELNIIGEGLQKTQLLELVQAQGMAGKINFRGRLITTAIVNEINANDALVMFSNYETFSLVVAEAFACGKPVITSKAGGLTDYIAPGMGIMVEKRNEAQLAGAMLSFANNKNNYNAANIRQYVVDNYSTEKIGRKLKAVYDAVLANTPVDIN